MRVVKSLLPAQVQVIQATGRRVTAALRRKRPAPSAAVRPDVGPTQVPRTTVSTFSFNNPSQPVKRARVEPTQGSCSRQRPNRRHLRRGCLRPCPWLQPSLHHRLHRRQRCLRHCHRPRPGHPSSAAAPSSSRTTSTTNSPPAPKIKAKNLQKLQEATDAAFDAVVYLQTGYGWRLTTWACVSAPWIKRARTAVVASVHARCASLMPLLAIRDLERGLLSSLPLTAGAKAVPI